MNTNGYNIFIVEDDNDLMKCYLDFMSDKFHLHTFASGVDAINTIKTSDSIDMVLLDHNLPDLPGIAILKEIRRIKPTLPVLMVTAYGDEDLAVKVFRYGARDYIKKPFNFKYLIEKIEFHLHADKIDSKEKFEEESHVWEMGSIGNYIVSDDRNNYKIQKAIKFIEDNYTKKISLEMVANNACMSKYHFSKIFKKIVGVTYQEYLNKQRIEHAKKLLKCGHCTIVEIAFAAGYEDLGHFGRMFRRSVGYSPTQYKKHLIPHSAEK